MEAEEDIMLLPLTKNKYAIHAYTHGPVTGSGPSVVSNCQVNEQLVASCPWPGELAKGPSSSLLPPRPLVSQCEAHGPPIGVGREKNQSYMK